MVDSPRHRSPAEKSQQRPTHQAPEGRHMAWCAACRADVEPPLWARSGIGTGDYATPSNRHEFGRRLVRPYRSATGGHASGSARR